MDVFFFLALDDPPDGKIDQWRVQRDVNAAQLECLAMDLMDQFVGVFLPWNSCGCCWGDRPFSGLPHPKKDVRQAQARKLTGHLKHRKKNRDLGGGKDTLLPFLTRVSSLIARPSSIGLEDVHEHAELYAEVASHGLVLPYQALPGCGLT